MRDKNREMARRMLLPSSNQPESPGRRIRDRLSHSGEEYGPLRWGHPAPRCETLRISEMSRVVLGFGGTSYDYVATNSRTHIPDARSSRGAAKFISPADKRWYSRKLRPSPVGATLNSGSGHVQSVCRTAGQHFHHI